MTGMALRVMTAGCFYPTDVHSFLLYVINETIGGQFNKEVYNRGIKVLLCLWKYTLVESILDH